MALDAELLMAAAGFGRWLAPKASRYTLEHRRQAANMLGDIADFWRDFLTEPARGDVELPEIDWPQMCEALTKVPDPEMVNRKTEGLTDEEVVDHIDLAQSCRQYLESKAPIRNYPTPLGPELADPSLSELLSFRQLYGVVDRPMRLLDEMLAGTITRDQAVAVENCYPELWSEMKQIGGDQLAKIRAAREDYQLGRRRVRLMEIFLRIPSDSPSSIPEHLQEIERRDQPNPSSGPKLEAPDVKTQAQRLEQR